MYVLNKYINIFDIKNDLYNFFFKCLLVYIFIYLFIYKISHYRNDHNVFIHDIIKIN